MATSGSASHFALPQPLLLLLFWSYSASFQANFNGLAPVRLFSSQLVQGYVQSMPSAIAGLSAVNALGAYPG